MSKYTKSELIQEIATLKQQLREREREQNYEVVPFDGEFSFDQC